MLEFRQIDDFIVNYQVYIWECRLLQRILVPHRICRQVQGTRWGTNFGPEIGPELVPKLVPPHAPLTRQN